MVSHPVNPQGVDRVWAGAGPGAGRLLDRRMGSAASRGRWQLRWHLAPPRLVRSCRRPARLRSGGVGAAAGRRGGGPRRRAAAPLAARALPRRARRARVLTPPGATRGADAMSRAAPPRSRVARASARAGVGVSLAVSSWVSPRRRVRRRVPHLGLWLRQRVCVVRRVPRLAALGVLDHPPPPSGERVVKYRDPEWWVRTVWW
jgi:hypothetical protein